VLGKEEKRKQYDQFGATFDQQGGFGGGMNWDDFMKYARGANGFGGFSANGGAGGWDFGGVDIGDIFGDLFGFGGGRRARPSQRRGEDIAIDFVLDFKEAVFGTKKEIRLNRKVVCRACKGDGKEPNSEFIVCSECGGKGQVTRVQRTFLGAIQTNSVCPKCAGEGKIPEKKCHVCAGAGIANDIQNIEVQIPSGIDDGDTLELRGQGNAARGGVGNLYVRIRVKPSKTFVREGNEILSRKKISVWQAMLGATVDVETVDGAVELKIPEGTQSGTVFRLRGKGVKRGGAQGDQLVTVEVEIPRLNRKQRKIIEDVADGD
jgi:molecular chaperone DnaJ